MIFNILFLKSSAFQIFISQKMTQVFSNNKIQLIPNSIQHTVPPAFLAEVSLRNHTFVQCRLSGYFNSHCILFCSLAQCTYSTHFNTSSMNDVSPLVSTHSVNAEYHAMSLIWRIHQNYLNLLMFMIFI